MTKPTTGTFERVDDDNHVLTTPDGARHLYRRTFSAEQGGDVMLYQGVINEPRGPYCAQCWLNGSGQFPMVDGECSSPRCVLKSPPGAPPPP